MSGQGEGTGVVVVAKALSDFGLDTRFNDWTSDHVPGLPFEVIREAEVLARFATELEADAYIESEQAKAAIDAMPSVAEARRVAFEECEALAKIAAAEQAAAYKICPHGLYSHGKMIANDIASSIRRAAEKG